MKKLLLGILFVSLTLIGQVWTNEAEPQKVTVDSLGLEVVIPETDEVSLAENNVTEENNPIEMDNLDNKILIYETDNQFLIRMPKNLSSSVITEEGEHLYINLSKGVSNIAFPDESSCKEEVITIINDEEEVLKSE